MSKLLIISFMLFLVLIGGSLTAYLVYYNNQALLEEKSYADTITKTRETLIAENEQFAREKQANKNSIEGQKLATDSQDQDNDGLNYAQEKAMGTKDTEVDSDHDGITDKDDLHPAGGGTTYKISVDWQHKGLPYRIQFGVPEDQYAFYKSQPRGYCCSDWEKFATPHDPIIQGIAKDITDISLSTGETCKTCLAIDFVESMIYQKDIDYNGDGEYPKYPIETIVDERGDCEDTSFLMASILEALNIDTILFSLPGHMAVGVYCPTCSGEYYAYNGRNYYFLETTQNSGEWKLGQIGYSPTLMRQYNLNKDVQQIIDVR